MSSVTRQVTADPGVPGSHLENDGVWVCALLGPVQLFNCTVLRCVWSKSVTKCWPRPQDAGRCGAGKGSPPGRVLCHAACESVYLPGFNRAERSTKYWEGPREHLIDQEEVSLALALKGRVELG